MLIGIPVSKGETQLKINNAYAEFVAEAGFEPILFSPLNSIEKIANICNGLLLPGGIDVEPTFYGENNLASRYCSTERDNFERRAMYAFGGRGKKVFGICRGFQLIVREFLRTNKALNDLMFFQHIHDHNHVSDRGIPRHTPSHSVDINSAVMYGTDDNETISIFVNSIHHQALIQDSSKKNRPLGYNPSKGNQLIIRAISDMGVPSKLAINACVVEAVDVMLEGAEMRGVQWHPEEMKDVTLLQTFFGEANNHGEYEHGAT